MSLGIDGMGEAMRRQAMEALQKAGSDAAPVEGAANAPEESAAERFREAMGREDAPAAENPAARAEAASAAGGEKPQSVGDRILEGISSTSEKVRTLRDEAAKAVAKENVTQADLLKANFAMLESGTIVAAAGKTTEKITQGLKSLQQG